MRITKITYIEEELKPKEDEKDKERREKEEWRKTLLLHHDGESAPSERLITDPE